MEPGARYTLGMSVRIALLFLLLLPLPAGAQQPVQRPEQSPAQQPAQQPARAPTAFETAFSLKPAADIATLEGAWAFKVDGTAIFRFDLKRAGTGWSGAWQRPRVFASNGAVFSNVTGPAVSVAANKGEAIGDWVELTFNDPRPGAVPDVFRLRMLPDGKAEAIYVGTGFAPLVLEKAEGNAQLGPWTATRLYQRAGVTAAPGAATVTFSVPTTARPAPAASPARQPSARPATGPVQGPPVVGR